VPPPSDIGAWDLHYVVEKKCLLILTAAWDL